MFFYFFFPHLFPADVRGQARQPVLGGRHTARASRGLPAVIRQEFGELGDVTADAGTMGGQFKEGGRQRPLCRDGNDSGPAGEPCIRRSCTKPRRGLGSACLGEGPGDLQGLTAPAAANLDRKNEEAAAPGSCKLRVATSFAVVGVVCRTARGGVGPGVRLPGTCDGADAGGVDGQLLSMIQAEPVDDNFEAAAIGN